MRDFFERYSDRVVPGAPDECWPWTGSTTSKLGYGHFNLDGLHRYAHREAYESVHGDGAAAGIVVRHTCDNPPCCNPGHLLGGTHADNSRDKHARGRANSPLGERVQTAKLTAADVIQARALAAAGMPISALTELFPIAHSAMTAMVTGRTWRHLPGAVQSPTKAMGPGAKSDRTAKLLSADDVRRIKEALGLGSPGRSLAAEFHVSPKTISAIKVGRIWAHV